MSTDQGEQLLSYENQVNYYTNYISENPLYEYAGTYADEGISGTNTKKRDEFNRMIADCRAGKIDMIITKSISRFARNTLDCLNYVRELKDLGIGIIFEKENINTLDAKGEVLLTILSSLAQDESRSISENCTWGIRRRFETGKHKMSTKRFLGYDTDETGKLVINRTQEPIVVRLYQEFLDGKTTDYIKRIFEREGVKNWDGGTKWQSTTLMSMLENEKYKGDALLQKSYDEAVETAFHIYRHWFQFTVPKAFRVVDSIQRLICEKRNIKPGSYSFFVQQLENDFIRENLSILVEFGIPSNAVRRLENVIPSNLSEDEVIDFIKKNRSNIKKYLLPYESERLEQCI